MRLLLSVLLAGLVATGFAQSGVTTGTVTGVIVDTQASAVPAATVELLNESGAVQRTVSGANGVFRFDRVPLGTYQVRAFHAGVGYATARIQITGIEPVNVTLALGISVRDRRAEPPTPPAAPPAPGRYDARTAAETGAPNVFVSSPSPAAQMQSGVHTFHVYPGHGSGVPRDNESYTRIEDNAFHRVSDDPLSTFSIDVDTASYANVRRFLNEGTLPPADAVRIEEMINYFRFDYATPDSGRPVSITTEMGPAPWNPNHRLVLVGLKARTVAADRTPPRNLVFLLDVSGSMNSPDKLPLVKTAMRMLTATLTSSDRVAIVVYAGGTGVALPSTSGANKAQIEQAIEDLRAGGSTNGAAGIQLAYDIASRSFVNGGINRVILATDGDFNVGLTSQGELMRLIEDRRQRGVFLSVLGVGTGNLKDSTMEQLADRGNGNYAYLDSLHEARRVLIAEAGATLMTVAKDVKIQVEFNPSRVGAYRLIGYENRVLANRDFNDDKKDAGEMGAGHTVTALYEIVPPGDLPGIAAVDPLRYRPAAVPAGADTSDELMTVKLRYKPADGDASQLMSSAVRDRRGALSPNLGFAAAIAQFGMLLRDSEHKGTATWSNAAELARRHRGEDADGYRAEAIRMIELASALDAQKRAVTRYRD